MSTSISTNAAGLGCRRKSIFTEIALDDDVENEVPTDWTSFNVSWGFPPVVDAMDEDDDEESDACISSPTKNTDIRWPPSPTIAFPNPSRLIFLALLLAVISPILHTSPLGFGAKASTIRRGASSGIDEDVALLAARDDSPATVCTRWAHQSALINGTLYIYGGQATLKYDQTDNTWNNNFLALDLKSNWPIGTPSLKGLPQPSGPPAVALGTLWHSYDSLFLYGGMSSWKPPVPPPSNSLWEYNIKSSTWTEHKNPQTSAGNNSEPSGGTIQRASEGASLSIPELGRGWYFGGHQDGYTTEGWSQSTPRIYLKSFVEYTFPGYSNDGVQGLAGKAAGSDGAWRNITQAGVQNTPGFTERADGLLVYVPGFGKEGILLALAGGTNATFTQMNVIDVYDISNSTWYKQATSGPTPQKRVNPCAVAVAAADGSSTNVYMHGGQNLVPELDQTLYNDTWILTIPSFTWIKIDTSNQSEPPARVGHTCNVWDGQMIVVGGYVGNDTETCDSPGIYVFDLSSNKWATQFTALTGGNDQNQQSSQDKSSIALAGSFGYQVPKVVQSVIGGNEKGFATVTAPAQSASEGPLATGKPLIYTVTASNGAIVTQTGSSSSTSIGNSNSGTHGPNIAAIVIGVVAGLLAVLAAYLGFCTWVYRRQLSLYKNHVAMSQRAAAGGPNATEKSTFLFPASSRGSEDRSSNPKKNNAGSISLGGGSGGSTQVGSGGGVGGGKNGLSMGAAGGAGGTGGVTNGISGIHPPVGGNSTANSSTEDLLAGQEPSFLGVVLSPRKSLRVVNRD
ncbi:MAG: hypothetical protein M1812_007198 [Candelaria pacifica]|nr:MAG: hypothetical protein M1812_007198 [Candelaria pacifica]